jgi:hypothetical protein
MKRVMIVIPTVPLALAIAAVAWAVTPSTGVYHGVVDGSPTGPCGGNEGEGFFKLRQTTSGKKIVPAGSFQFCGGPASVSKILAPSDFACNQLNATLEVGRIPVSQGSFDYTGASPIGPGGANRQVRFKGTWQTASKVTGYTRITGGGCDSGRVHWTMKPI